MIIDKVAKIAFVLIIIGSLLSFVSWIGWILSSIGIAVGLIAAVIKIFQNF